ncbi:MAG: pseudouridine synthase [Butyribacter sp.]|nr:pseudouridine synthase [bacterium]MDY3854341.1 pseudouridine synthase [Butyribacter sp.]
MRLDKYLAQADVGTRSEVKKMIRCGRVLLNGVPAKKPEQKITKEDIIIADGKEIHFSQYRYFMLNKPAGVVSATMDKNDTTVVELIDDAHSKNLFPVGRLDKDTEGLLLMTNDGALAHELLSPRKHVEKTYFVRVHGKVTEEDSAQFAQGMDIGDEKLTKPASLTDIRYTGEDTELYITITEGRYHQIKRMFARVGKPVVYLKRIAMGSLRLDETLTPGAYRELTEEEIFSLKNRNN